MKSGRNPKEYFPYHFMGPVVLGASIIFPLFFFLALAALKLKKKEEEKKKKPAKSIDIDKPLNLPPGPWKIPVIGNIHQMLGNSDHLPHHRLRELAKEYGGLMRLQLGEITTIVISSPEMAKAVMKTHDLAFCERPFVLALDILFYGSKDVASSPYGEYWRQMRKLCVSELLSARRVQSFRGIREGEVSALIRSLYSSRGTLVNLTKMLLSLQFSITVRATFGNKCRDQDAFVTALKGYLSQTGGFSLLDFFPSLKFLPAVTGTETKLRKLQQQMDIILESIILQARGNSNISSDQQDLVHVLLNLQGHGGLGIPLSDNNIKAVILDMFVAGIESVSTTVEWAISELLKNPRTMRKAQAEVRQVFHEQGEVVESGLLQELKYLKCVIKEILRLHPPAPLLLPRECREACQISGYDIPVKARVVVNAWAIGRDPDHWVDPESFIPERFLESSSLDYKVENFEYIPFGAGRRSCPGMLYGLAGIELLLAQLLHHFDWELPHGIKHEDLDMTEAFGAAVCRKHDLSLVPVPYKPFPGLKRIIAKEMPFS